MNESDEPKDDAMTTEIRLEDIERPLGGNDSSLAWGSDAIAETLRRCGVPYVAMVPGSSYRGLQDSFVNYLGNRDPQMLVCLHEEHAVAIAHGYFKATDRAMAAATHSNVGLMHALMAIYNAYCDRAPVLLLGATGPVDATRRRPWIDWIHTTRDQGSLLRGYVKWDEQPGSPRAGMEATLRAWRLINAHPKAPAYVCYDVADQERGLDEGFTALDVDQFAVPSDPAPAEKDIVRAIDLLSKATTPVILAGRSSRRLDAWNARIRLAEMLGAKVITDIKTAAAFPTRHPLHVGGTGTFLSSQQKAAIAEADAILSLDWLDLGGLLEQALGQGAKAPPVISATLDDQLANGWSYDHYSLPPTWLRLATTNEIAVEHLLAHLDRSQDKRSRQIQIKTPSPDTAALPGGESIGLVTLARTIQETLEGIDHSFLRFPLGWPADETPFDHPLDYLGADGGAGVGSGPGLAVGAALGLRGTGRIPVAILGDGDFVMGGSALWTAARYRVPLLVVVANNRSYYNDEIHQEVIARNRERPTENRWIGQRLDDPAVDILNLARSLGAVSPERVEKASDLPGALQKAIDAVKNGAVYVLDVEVTQGYASSLPATVGGDER
jgi:thiamine pyrophosphate-dependent acetolactate synthase large subunit-like protein